MAGRGLKTEAIYFHAYPYTSEEALGKVKKLASLLAPYKHGHAPVGVPFTDPSCGSRITVRKTSIP
jgi:thiamine biosynthesis protein ThiI